MNINTNTNINSSVPVEQVRGQTVAGPKNDNTQKNDNTTEKQNNIKSTEYQYKGKIINTTA